MSDVARGAGRNDDVRRRLDPLAAVIDAGEGVDGADDGIGGRLYVAGALDDVAESEANIAVAPLEEIRRMSVAENRAAAHLIVDGDAPGREPVDEVVLNGVALGVAADGAMALVMGSAGTVVGGRGVAFGERPFAHNRTARRGAGC